MPKKKRVPINGTRKAKSQTFAERAKAIRSQVSFKIDLKRKPTAYEKRRVKVYYDALKGSDEQNGLLNRNVYPVTSKNRKRLEKLQAELGQPKLKYLKFAYVRTYLDPQDRIVPAKVHWRSDGPNVVQIGNIKEEVGLFDPTALASDPRAEIRRVLATLPKNASSYHVRNGQFEMNGQTLSGILEQILGLMSKYDVAGSKNYRHWLIGIKVMKATGRTTVTKFRQKVKDSQERRKVLQKQARKRKPHKH